MRIALKQTVGVKCIRFMKDGELGAIVHFPCQSDKTGLIVQRY